MGSASALKTIGWAAVLLAFILSLWALVAVTLLNPITTDLARIGAYGDCERCGRAYSSILISMVTLMQTVLCGDSWGQVAVPVIEAEPYTLLIFGAIWATISVGIMNLILAVIVDSAAQDRMDDVAFQLEIGMMHGSSVKKKFLAICGELDQDGDGILTHVELLSAYSTQGDIQNMFSHLALDISKMENLLRHADKDGDGLVQYEEFATTMLKLKTMDVPTLGALMKQDVVEIKGHAVATRGYLEKSMLAQEEHRKQQKQEPQQQQEVSSHDTSKNCSKNIDSFAATSSACKSKAIPQTAMLTPAAKLLAGSPGLNVPPGFHKQEQDLCNALDHFCATLLPDLRSLLHSRHRQPELLSASLGNNPQGTLPTIPSCHVVRMAKPNEHQYPGAVPSLYLDVDTSHRIV